MNDRINKLADKLGESSQYGFLFKMTALTVAMALIVLGAGVAFADTVTNDVTASASGKILSVTKGQTGKSVTYTFDLTDPTDPVGGCNAGGGSNAVTFAFPGLPTGVTATPATSTLTNCDPVTIVFAASSSAVVGSYSISPSLSGGKSANLGKGETAPSSWNTTNAGFTLQVAAANTAPSVTVTGVTQGASYEYGGVPAAGCSITDTQDGNSTKSASLSSITGALANLGLGSRTATCNHTDTGGLSATEQTATFSIVDTTKPVLTMPGNILKEATGSTGATASWSAIAVTDNVPGQTLSASCDRASGSTFPIGATTVTCSATDAANNSKSGSFTVTVQDTTAPVVTASQDLTVEATSADGAEVTFDPATSTDAVDGPKGATCNATSGATFALGSTLVTCRATDAAGNTGYDYFTINVQDKTAPSFTAPASQTLEATGANGATATWDAGSASDAVDGSVPVNCDATSGHTFPLGTTTVACSATDNANNTSQGSFTIAVQDTRRPTLSLPENITEEATGSSGDAVSFEVSASDIVDGARPVDCGEDASGDTYPIGVTTVSCTASDNAGNVASGSFTITVTDTTAPAITVPSTITEEATGPNGARVTYQASASDIVDGTTTVNCAPASGSLFAIGTTSVTCASSDDHGNADTKTFDIIVEDSTPPAVTVPNATIVEEATGGSGAAVSFTASATDVVDGDIVPNCLPASGSTFAVGTTDVTCRAEDTAHNEGAASFKITVQDTTKPDMTLPGNILLEATSADGADAEWTLGQASDIVDGSLPINCDADSGDTFELGTTPVNCSATDAAGNTRSGSFNVTVQDTTDPEVDVPDNIMEEATSSAGAVATWDAATASDIVDGNVATTCDSDSGDTFPLGVTTVTCTATDAADNEGSNTFTVSVLDRRAPVIPSLDNVTAEATGPEGAIATWTLPKADDVVDGEIDLSCDYDSGDLFELGVTTVTCTAVDAAGNDNEAGFTVTVEDTTIPELTVPGNRTVEATSADGAVVTYTASASDIVDGDLTPECTPASGGTFGITTTTVTCTITDAAGNEASDSFTITVEDTTAPELTLPADITREAERILLEEDEEVGTSTEATSIAGARVEFETSSDDIVDGVSAPTCSPASGSVFVLGVTKVNCELTDRAGNKATKSFNVTVEDTLDPFDITFVGGPPAGSSHIFGSVPAKPTCQASDSGSGVKSCVVTGYSTDVGSRTLTATATDNVGNTSEITRSYRVLGWNLTGFYSPVDMTPAGASTITYNTVKGGSTVPLKFELFAGATELTDIAEITTRPSKVSCSAGIADAVEVLATGGTVLRHDGSQFVFNWKTPSEPGACYKVVVGSTDGSTSVAHFKLK